MPPDNGSIQQEDIRNKHVNLFNSLKHSAELNLKINEIDKKETDENLRSKTQGALKFNIEDSSSENPKTEQNFYSSNYWQPSS